MEQSIPYPSSTTFNLHPFHYLSQMKWCLLILFFTTLLSPPSNSQSLIINRHSVAQFDSIPEEYKIAAAQQRMMFMDRSVGWNIHSFLDCLSEPWSEAPSYCKRYLHMDSIYNVDPSEVYWEGAWDRSNWYFRFWPEGCSEDVNCFIDFVDDRLDSFGIMGCQFSYLAVTEGVQIADPVNGFFGDQGNDNKASTYAMFAADHPDKKLIWWTTSLARGIGTPESEAFNSQMREYAAAHEIILFDVADILSHDPDGNPCYDNRDGVAYKDENHPDDGVEIPAICPQYTTETEGGHLGSISAGGVRVAKAFSNPANEEINVSFENSYANAEIFLIDILGSIRKRVILKNSNSISIPVAEFEPGIYLVKINSVSVSQSQKILIGR